MPPSPALQPSTSFDRHGRTPRAGFWTRDAGRVAPIVLAMAAVLALVLALPGQTVTTRYLGDLFVALDGAHRVLAGQVPSRDFHTPWGPLVTYIPAAGYWLSGTLGGAMPVGMALVIAVLAPAMAHVFASRLHPIIALPLAAFLLLILAVPMNLGESVTSVSHAKFYNRVGWGALATLLVMYLPTHPEEERREWADVAAAAVLTLVMVYNKATYGAVALAFLAFMLLMPGQRRWAALALGVVVVSATIIELLWRGTAAYAADVLQTLRIGGVVRGSAGQIFDHLLTNLADYVFLALLIGLALRATRSLRDALFYLFCAVTGFLVINQNFQTWGIIAIHAAAAVAAERLVRHAEAAPETTERTWSMAAGAQLVFIALVLPTIVHCTIPLTLHAAAATARVGDEVVFPNMKGVRIANLWTPGEYGALTTEVAAIRDGAAALARLEPKPARVVALDFANPFSAALGLAPARGDAAFLQWERNVDSENFIPPERLLAGVDVVMEPKPGAGPSPQSPTGKDPRAGLQELYGPFIAANFDLVAESASWRIHRRRATASPAPR
jgi:hypothetical protein